MPSALAPQAAMPASSAAYRGQALALENQQGGAVATALAASQQAQEERARSARQRIIDFGVGRDSLAAQITGRAAALASRDAAFNANAAYSQQREGEAIGRDVAGTFAGAAVGALPDIIDGVQRWGASRRARSITNSPHASNPYPVSANTGVA